MHAKITKAIFPVAGLGTRFLPATKSIPKEILTLVDRPLIQYAIDEARAAGITEFIFVTARGKSALEDYFDHAPQLEAQLREKGKEELLQLLETTNMDSGSIAYIRQHSALGVGHAVWCARKFIGNEPFAVILPDDVIAAEKPCLQLGHLLPVKKMVEKPIAGTEPSNLAVIGRYLLTPSVMDNIVILKQALVVKYSLQMRLAKRSKRGAL